MKKTLTYLIMIALICNLLFGCNKALPKPEGVTLLDFQLGESSTFEQDTEISYPLDGLLGIPKGDTNPVVFILHGAHPVEDVTETRYYKGFEYLVRHLAENGYLAISINMNRAYSLEPIEGIESDRAYNIFKDYYSLLEKANSGEKIFSYDLTGKANLDQINFIGHSRGGDNSLHLTKTLKEQGNSSVQSVLLVAPPFNSPLEEAYTDIPTGIILPQYDGDVATLNGVEVFNYVYLLDSNRKTPITSAFLYGGDHSQFNTELAGRDVLFTYENVTYITPTEQQDFLKQYATDFLNHFNFNMTTTDLIETLGNVAPPRYPVDFMPSIRLPEEKKLVTPNKNLAALKENRPNLLVEYAEMSIVPTEDTIAPFNHPYALSENMPLYRISWQDNALELTFPMKNMDFTSFNYLSLYMANNPTVLLNDDSTPIAFEIELLDMNGHKASYKLDALKDSALRYIATPIVNVFEGMDDFSPYWKAKYYTPLSTQIIPLSNFSNLDFRGIESITLKGISSSGSIILGGIDLY
ncbi:hypothetical protein QTL86_13375 [Cellulosilyticum sp. ST5]|uniref:hypothetical protein n=1 Tax=Cellulosilyticum sp. ST5 TaxID=3055805 RepID=UPI003977D60F